ncbi:unnamed protein product, partial [Didymodactylos carnosus]
LYVLAGSNTYELIRINLPGALPSISALEHYNKNIDLKMNECHFRFDRLTEHLDTINSKNSFVGFIPSHHKGIPQTSSYQTDDFQQLQERFMTIDKSSLINVHMVEPLLPSLTTTTVTMPTQSSKSRPFLLAAYGTDTKSIAIDILRRWIYIYERCKLNDIRIIGYSADCAGKYLKAMRLTNESFSRLPNINLIDIYHNDLFEIDLPHKWKTWFYLRPKQLFLCFQDGIHLAKKIRNRLLSKHAQLFIGKQSVD